MTNANEIYGIAQAIEATNPGLAAKLWAVGEAVESDEFRLDQIERGTLLAEACSQSPK